MELLKRTKGKLNHNKSTKDAYEYYKNNNVTDVSKLNFLKVAKELNEKLLKLCIADNIPLYLPYMGKIEIRKYKRKLFDEEGNLKFRIIDYKKTNEARKETGDPEVIILRTNDHSDGFTYKFYWRKNYCQDPLIKRLAFKAVRNLNRFLAEQILTEKNDYYEIRAYKSLRERSKFF
tara:strand:- start:6436 stop:6963 length:528 start_codon:yes stop_codon:yes gene_type:complete